MVGAGPSFCEDYENPSSPGWPGMPVSGSGRDVFLYRYLLLLGTVCYFYFIPVPFSPPCLLKKKKKKKKKKSPPPSPQIFTFFTFFFFLRFFLGYEIQPPVVGNGVLPFVLPPPVTSDSSPPMLGEIL